VKKFDLLIGVVELAVKVGGAKAIIRRIFSLYSGFMEVKTKNIVVQVFLARLVQNAVCDCRQIAYAHFMPAVERKGALLNFQKHLFNEAFCL
jgi:hypothetical protein